MAKTTAPPKNPNSTKKEREENAANRRAAILDFVVNQGQSLSLEEAEDQYKVSRAALYKDLEYFNRRKAPIAIDRGAFRHDEDHLRTVERRKTKDTDAKQAIARITATLILGPDIDREVVPKQKDGKEVAPKQKDGNRQLDEEQRWFPSQPREIQMPFELKSRLRGYFAKAHRLAILDAGTTTAAIAAELAEVVTPAPARRLSSLRVLTNGRTVADELDRRRCSHEIILLGGGLRKDTEAIAGTLAEMCLDAWCTRTGSAAFADICVIGTTNLDSNCHFFCDHEIEAQIKSRLLSSARVRCIAASSAKIIDCVGGTWAFCTFSPQFVDMVITDDRIQQKQSDVRREEARLRFLSEASAARIHVLVAPPAMSRAKDKKDNSLGEP